MLRRHFRTMLMSAVLLLQEEKLEKQNRISAEGEHVPVYPASDEKQTLQVITYFKVCVENHLTLFSLH